jgi:hypothetical protein
VHITQATRNGNRFGIPRYAAATGVKIPWNSAKQDSSMCQWRASPPKHPSSCTVPIITTYICSLDLLEKVTSLGMSFSRIQLLAILSLLRFTQSHQWQNVDVGVLSCNAVRTCGYKCFEATYCPHKALWPYLVLLSSNNWSWLLFRITTGHNANSCSLLQ